MLPNFGYGRQIIPTDVKKQGLSQMSANRPNIGSTGNIGRWEMKNCTPLWCKSHFEVQMLKHSGFRALLEFRRSKSAGRCCSAKHVSRSKWQKHKKTHYSRSTLGSYKVHRGMAESRLCTFRSQNPKSTTCSDNLGQLLEVQSSFCVAGAKDSAPCQQWAKCEDFVTLSKAMAGVGHLKGICKDACR